MNLAPIEEIRIYTATRSDAAPLSNIDKLCNENSNRNYLEWVELIDNKIHDIMVAYVGKGVDTRIAGCIVAIRNNIEVFNVMNAPASFMHNVGQKLLSSLAMVQGRKFGDLSPYRLVVDENFAYENKVFQEFVKAVGFKATTVLKGAFHDCGYPVDGILFEST